MAEALFVFRYDLRLGDHAGLAAAALIGNVTPVIVIDAALRERLCRSPRRAAFFCAAVTSLADDLARRGSRLLVRRGERAQVLRELAADVGATAVIWSVAYDASSQNADRDVQSALEEAGLRVVAVHDAPVLPPEESAAVRRSGDAYRALVPYGTRWRAFAVPPPAREEPRFARSGAPSEALPAAAEFGSAERCARPVSEAAAAAACARYLEHGALSYAVARNVPGGEGTSCLSADLAFGTLAARTVVRATRERARDPFLLTEEKLSLALFLRSFAQRDFFLQLAWFGDRLGDAPLQPKMRGFVFADDHPALEAWRNGRTGYPLVDAGVRQLQATGWMHPRVRAIVASFLCFDLGVDWRVGRDEWDRWLVEDTPALATGNWQWIAGVGADLAAYPRIYHPLKQARRFDPAGTYVRRWIPELAHVPDAAIVQPGARPTLRQLPLDLYGSTAYPAPVLDHEQAARLFLRRYGRDVRPSASSVSAARAPS